MTEVLPVLRRHLADVPRLGAVRRDTRLRGPPEPGRGAALEVLTRPRSTHLAHRGSAQSPPVDSLAPLGGRGAPPRAAQGRQHSPNTTWPTTISSRRPTRSLLSSRWPISYAGDLVGDRQVGRRSLRGRAGGCRTGDQLERGGQVLAVHRLRVGPRSQRACVEDRVRELPRTAVPGLRPAGRRWRRSRRPPRRTGRGRSRRLVAVDQPLRPSTGTSPTSRRIRSRPRRRTCCSPYSVSARGALVALGSSPLAQVVLDRRDGHTRAAPRARRSARLLDPLPR